MKVQINEVFLSHARGYIILMQSDLSSYLFINQAYVPLNQHCLKAAQDNVLSLSFIYFLLSVSWRNKVEINVFLISTHDRVSFRRFKHNRWQHCRFLAEQPKSLHGSLSLTTYTDILIMTQSVKQWRVMSRDVSSILHYYDKQSAPCRPNVYISIIDLRLGVLVDQGRGCFFQFKQSKRGLHDTTSWTNRL
jgi:hypothetical protein